ncbi:N-acetylmuramoyl-L-alanine amidase family protein [Bacillus alkalicola]|nr:peptidoglycan recognition family protein [Bacillus alkalicola]
MVKNDCYKSGRKIKPRGIMIHSTATPGVMAAAWFSRWNKSYQAGEMSRQVCVHAFVDDGEVWQYLPWNHRGWHSGGAANNTHIGIEMCEPGGFTYGKGSVMVGYAPAVHERYFRAVWKNTVSLCVMLCRMYGLTEKEILCHSEGRARGIASNHGDVMHWFPKHGENMDRFRLAVRRELASGHPGDIGGGSGAGGGGTQLLEGAQDGATSQMAVAVASQPEGKGKAAAVATKLVKQPDQQPVAQQDLKQAAKESSQSTNSKVPSIAVGDVIEVLVEARTYYPGGPTIPNWVKTSCFHRVIQVTSQGRKVMRGGAECVLLGKRIDRKSGVETDGIMTWIDRRNVKKRG